MAYNKRAANLRLRYGITEQDWDVLYEAQGGRCPICESTDNLVVDHCHDTGEVRGLLCRLCNASLGGFADSIERLALAIVYLSP